MPWLQRRWRTHTVMNRQMRTDKFKYSTVLNKWSRMLEITPWRLTTPPGDYTPSCNPPERNPTWCAYPRVNPHPSIDTESADRDRRRSRRHIYSSPPPAPYIKKFATDTDAAFSLITRSQLTAAQCLAWFQIKAAWATYSKVKSLHQLLSDLLGSTTVSADQYRRRSRRHTYSPPPPPFN